MNVLSWLIVLYLWLSVSPVTEYCPIFYCAKIANILGFNWSQLDRQNKKKSVFGVTGLKNLGRAIGTHIFFLKKYNFMHFEKRNDFQNA